MGRPDFRRWAGIICKKDTHRIDSRRSDKEHSFTPLRQTEGSGIDDTIGPPVVEVLELRDDVPNCFAPIQLEHERNVLEQDVGDTGFPQETEHLADDRRLAAFDSGGPAGLREVLAGEAAEEKFGLSREALQLSDVADIRDLRKAAAQDGRCGQVVFRHEDGFVSGAVQA
jgi:hypothetical protein